jgi:hypothetical protein
MTRPNFEISLAKGELGEVIVRQIMENKGWVVYKPITDGAHPFDILAIKNKDRAIALDVKAKSRMNKFPATGIDKNHFLQYQAFSFKHNMPFYLVFVDEAQKSIYGQSLDELEKKRVVHGVSYPFDMPTSYKQVRLWPLVAMKHIANIDEIMANKLSALSQRNYQYSA